MSDFDYDQGERDANFWGGLVGFLLALILFAALCLRLGMRDLWG